MSTYSVARRGGCVLVNGSIPAGDLIALCGLSGKGANLSPNLARLAGATFAWGTSDAVAALTDGLSIINQVEAADSLGYPPTVDLVIAGGESGPHARPSHPDWFRSLRDQCAAAGVPFMFKQWGEWAPAMSKPSETPGRYAMMARDPMAWTHNSAVLIDRYPRQFTSFGSVVLERVGKKAAGRLLDGVEHNGRIAL